MKTFHVNYPLYLENAILQLGIIHTGIIETDKKHLVMVYKESLVIMKKLECIYCTVYIL
jgi:hypothetical protein